MKFTVKILETLAKVVEIEAETKEIALQTAKKQYTDEFWVLDSSDFQDVEFLLIETEEDYQTAPKEYERDLENEFYANMRYDDISPEMMDFGDEYHSVESKLATTYTPEQMEMYVMLESMRESILVDIKKSFYKKGYVDAMKHFHQES